MTAAGHDESAARDAAQLIRAADTAALATLERGTGFPYASHVTVAIDGDGALLLLLSKLARHTQNLDADPRASLLFTPVTAATGDPLASARVTLVGRLAPTANPSAPARFLARHPDAAVYAGFADFRFFALDLEHAHFIGGFGRIIEVPVAELRVSLTS